MQWTENTTGYIVIIKSISIGGSTTFTVSKLKVVKDLSGRNATADIDVFSDVPATAPSDFDEVIIKDHNDNTVFGGFVTAINRERVDKQGVLFKILAKDYNLLLETTLATLDHTSISDRAIIQAEFSANLPEIATTDSTIEIIKSNIDAFDARNISLAEMMKRLLSLTAGEFWVDFDKVLHYFTPGNNVASFEMSDEPHGENVLKWSQDFVAVNDGARAPTAAVGTNWVDPTNVFVEDGNDAQYNGLIQPDLKSTVFGFSIPTGATAVVTGVEVTIRGRGAVGSDAGRTIEVGLTKNGTALVGTRKTLVLSLFPDYSTQTLGDSSDLWGTSFFASDINASTFGVLLRDNDTTGGNLRIDSILVTVSYSKWLLDDLTIIEDTIKSPGGDVDALKMEEEAVSGDHKMVQESITQPETGVDYTATVFMKAGERDFGLIILKDGGGTNGFAYFNISTGTIGTIKAGNTATMEAVGDGWYRCEVTRKLSGTTVGVSINIAKQDNQVSYLGVIGQGIYVWGAQVGRSETFVPEALSPSVVAGTSWTNPTNVLASDDTRADYNDTAQDELKVTGFSTGVPLTARIVGIEVSIEGFGDDADAAQRTIEVGLTKDGVTLAGTRKTLVLNQSTDTTQVLGSATDLWGGHWGTGHVNNAEFGILIRDNDTTAAGIHLDHVQVTVYYTNIIPVYGRTLGAAISRAAPYKMKAFTSQFLNPINDVTVRGARDSSGVEIIVNKTNAASIAEFRTFEGTVTDRNITNSTVADLRADVVLASRANPQQRGSFQTISDGLEIGQQVNVTNAAHALTSEPFTIRRLVLEQINRLTTEYTVDFGPVRDDIVSLMQRINRVAVADPVFPTGDPPPLSVGTLQLQNDAVTTLKINAQAVTNAKIEIDAIQGAVIAASAIVETMIAPDAVTSPKIFAGAVIAGKIAAGAVIAGTVAANVITGVEIQGGSITATDAVFATAAIVEADIKDLAVTNAKIGLLAVDTAQIQALAVEEAKIGLLAVTKAKIGLLAVDTAQIATAAITEAKIEDLAVTTAKINSLDAAKINAGTITSVNVSAGTYTLTSGINTMVINGTDGFKQTNTSTGNFVKILTGLVTISNSGGTSHVDIDTVSVSVESATARLTEMGTTSIDVNNSSGSARASLELVSNDGRCVLRNNAGTEVARIDAGGGLGQADSGYVLCRSSGGLLKAEMGVNSSGDGEVKINSNFAVVHGTTKKKIVTASVQLVSGNKVVVSGLSSIDSAVAVVIQGGTPTEYIGTNTPTGGTVTFFSSNASSTVFIFYIIIGTV